MKQLIFETKIGDWLCYLIEHFLGIALLPVEDLEWGKEASDVSG